MGRLGLNNWRRIGQGVHIRAREALPHEPFTPPAAMSSIMTGLFD
jgi:hypothetical protein